MPREEFNVFNNGRCGVVVQRVLFFRAGVPGSSHGRELEKREIRNSTSVKIKCGVTWE